MSHFYGSMQGSRGEATRQGTKQSGMSAHIRGWDVGIEVEAEVDENGYDHLSVYRTSGSNGRKPRKLIAECTNSGSWLVTELR